MSQRGDEMITNNPYLNMTDEEVNTIQNTFANYWYFDNYIYPIIKLITLAIVIFLIIRLIKKRKIEKQKIAELEQKVKNLEEREK